MARDVKYRSVQEYNGTLKDFNKQLYQRELMNGESDTLSGTKPMCDLSVCPLGGAYMTLSKIGSLIILFHSPPGCSTGLWVLWGGAHKLKSVTGTKKSSECITLCSNMNERDIIYGGTEKLRGAVKDIHERYAPEHLVILSSCCPGIIGDDFNEVVEEARDKYDMSIGWLDSSGFKSSYWPNGYDLAHLYIVEHIMKMPGKIEENTINVISYGNAASADERECCRLLEQLGLNPQLPMSVPYTNIEKIKRAPYAKANVMMCLTYGWNFCTSMKERFGTEYSVESHPIGSIYTKKWLRAIGEIFHKEDEVERLILEEEEEIQPQLKKLKEQLAGKKIAITAGHDKAASLIAMAYELDLKICYIGLVTYDDLVIDKIDEIANMLTYDVELKVFPQTYEEVPLIKKYDPDIFIGPAGLTAKNIMVQIPSVSTHFNDFIGTYFGFKGLINFGQEILNAINDPMPRFAPIDFITTGSERICGRKWFNNTKKWEDEHEKL